MMTMKINVLKRVKSLAHNKCFVTSVLPQLLPSTLYLCHPYSSH